MKYRHFFWDFDGTLYDTYGRITRAATNALGDMGVKLTADEVFPVAKRSLFAVCAKWAEPLGYTYDQFLEIYHRHSEQEGAESIRPFPGALETLREVVERGGITISTPTAAAACSAGWNTTASLTCSPTESPLWTGSPPSPRRTR